MDISRWLLQTKYYKMAKTHISLVNSCLRSQLFIFKLDYSNILLHVRRFFDSVERVVFFQVFLSFEKFISLIFE